MTPEDYALHPDKTYLAQLKADKGQAAVDAFKQAVRESKRAKVETTAPPDPKTTLVFPVGGVPTKNHTWGALQFIADYGEDVRYCFPWKCWMIWNGQRWQRDETDQVILFIRNTLLKIQAAADQSPNPEKLRTWVHGAFSTANTRAIEKSAQSLAPILPDDFDNNPWLLNTPTGTVDLKTGELRTPQRSDYLTKMTSVGPKKMPCPLWERQLAWMSFFDPDWIASLQRLLGYCLTGLTIEHILVLAYGSGSNGKGTLFNLLQAIFGDYTTTANTSLLTGGKTVVNGATPDLMQTVGKRLVLVGELEENARLSVNTVKQIASSDQIFARNLYEQGTAFTPQAKVIVPTNHLPRSSDVGYGIVRRLFLLPFSNQVQTQDRDTHLGEKLLTEAEGVLDWLIQGCLFWQQGGLTTCARSEEATKQYWDAMDILGEFLQGYEFDPDAPRLNKQEFYADYCVWCESSGIKPRGHPQFSQAFHERHPEVGEERQAKIRFWKGIRKA